MHHLVAHPDTPAASVSKVDILLLKSFSGELWLEFYVYPRGALVLPAPKDPARSDGLWRTTCFELFVRFDGGPGYLEFNFSPSFGWAAYAFDGYREGMREYPIDDPVICIDSDPKVFMLAVEALAPLPPRTLQIALSAVIEEKDGTKSYWALRHPSGAPDFHHPDCFALTLEAPDAA